MSAYELAARITSCCRQLRAEPLQRIMDDLDYQI